MNTRTKRETVTFSHPFSLDGLSKALPAGDYEVVTDEELIEGLSFPVYRRVATMMMVPTKTGATEMLTVDPLKLAELKERDRLRAVCKADAVQVEAR